MFLNTRFLHGEKTLGEFFFIDKALQLFSNHTFFKSFMYTNVFCHCHCITFLAFYCFDCKHLKLTVSSKYVWGLTTLTSPSLSMQLFTWRLSSPKKNKKTVIIYSSRCRWKIRWENRRSCVVHKTALGNDDWIFIFGWTYPLNWGSEHYMLHQRQLLFHSVVLLAVTWLPWVYVQ